MPQLRALIREGEVAWNPEFTRLRNFYFKDLGKSYIDWKAESRAVIAGEDIATAQAALLDAKIIPMFMRDDEDIKISAEADKVEAFCSNSTLRCLITEACDGGPSLKPVALLDTRTLDGTSINNTWNQTPLTARQLYQALKEPRSRPSNTQLPHESAEISAVRRRHTFITDLDCWCISAIVGTALRYQKSAIRSMIYGHLQFRPWINVNMCSEGKRFELEFHLPYTLLRDSNAPNTDTRRFRDDRTLRRYQDVSFLNPRRRDSATYRYEAQISFVVIGLDYFTWDTYCFDDAYFDPIQYENRLVEFYDESSHAADGTRVAIDPSTRGRPDSDSPDPPQCFLSVLRYSLEHVKAEWRRNVDRVHDSIRDFEHDPQGLSESHEPGRKAEDLNTIESITLVNDLSTTLLTDLTLEVDIIKTFVASRQPLFRTELCTALVSEISRIMEELEYLKKILETDMKRCENLMKKRQNSLSQEITEAGRKNQFISKLIYPMVMAMGMFSMEGHVLPFKATTAAFVCVLSVFGALIHLCYDPSWYWRAVSIVADKVGFPRFLRKPAESLPHEQSAESPARSYSWRHRDVQVDASSHPVVGV